MAANYAEVLGSKMHYVEVGQGNPILFLHGIPTSSYLWRNITPYLSQLGRCIAVDLIGFGKSDKPDIAYSVFDHIQYIETFINTLKLKNVTLVMHGWGSVIGFDYAMRNEANCSGLIFYEAFLRSLSASDVSLPFQEQIVDLQAQENAYDLILNSAFFVDKVLPQNMMSELNESDMNVYRAPFARTGAGKPIVQYLKELSHGDGKSKVDKLIADYTKKLTVSQLPKLMLYSVPGFITPMATVMWAKEHLPNLEVVDIGEELHLGQESCPELMGEAMSAWMQGIEQQS